MNAGAEALAITFFGFCLCYALYQWALLIGGMINGHRRAREALHSGPAAPAGDGAGAGGGGSGSSTHSTYTSTFGSGVPGHATATAAGYAKALAMAQQNLPNPPQFINIPAAMAKGLTAAQQIVMAQHMYQAQQMQQHYQNQLTHQQLRNKLNPFYGQVVEPATVAPIPHGGIKLGEIIGYRVWLIAAGGYLKSCSADAVWAPGETMEGDIGKDGHGLGVHAWKSKSLMLQYGGIHAGTNCVVGSVRLWGEIVQHERGYRAQYASILSLDDVIAPGYELKAVSDSLEVLRRKYALPAK